MDTFRPHMQDYTLCPTIKKSEYRADLFWVREASPWASALPCWPQSLVHPAEGPSANTLLTAQSTFTQILIFGSQWPRLFPLRPLACVDIFQKQSQTSKQQYFFMLSIIAKGAACLYVKSFFKNPRSNTPKFWSTEKAFVPIILCNFFFSKDNFKEELVDFLNHYDIVLLFWFCAATDSNCMSFI